MAEPPDPRRHRPARRQLLRRRPGARSTRGCARTRPCTSTRRTTCGASRRTRRCSRPSKDPKTFSNAGGIRPDNGPDPDDDRHGRPRALEAPQARQQGLHAAAGCATASRRSATRATRSSTRCASGASATSSRDIAAPLPMILIGDMLGVAPEDRDDLLRWSDDMVSAQSGSATEEQCIAGDGRDGRVHRRSARTRSRNARRNPTDDLMSVLVHAEVDGDRLDARRRAARVAAHPRRRRRDDPPRDQRRHGAAAAAPRPAASCCIDDPAKITVAVEEMLRWVTPIKNMCRTVTHDIEFMGQQLHEGQKCMLLYESANRDEDEVRRPVPLRHRAPAERARRVRLRRALLPRSGAGPPRAQGHVRAAARRACPTSSSPPTPTALPRRPRQLHQRPRVDAGARSRRRSRCSGARV